MASIFLITTGSYSSYSVRCAFTTRRKAQEWKRKWEDKYGFNYTRIEEFPLDPHEPADLGEPNIRPHWILIDSETGEFPDETKFFEDLNGGCNAAFQDEHRGVFRLVTGSVWNNKKGKPDNRIIAYSIIIDAPNDVAARKAAYELYMQAKAKGELPVEVL